MRVSHLSRDLTWPLRINAASYASTASSLIAGHRPKSAGVGDSRDVSIGSVTKYQGPHENKRILRNLKVAEKKY
jgi:hypothetical protein